MKQVIFILLIAFFASCTTPAGESFEEPNVEDQKTPEFAGENGDPTLEVRIPRRPIEETVRIDPTDEPDVVSSPPEEELEVPIEEGIEDPGTETEEVEEVEEEIEEIEEEVEQETSENVTDEEQNKIDSLRTAIFAGLDVGRYVYVEEISLQLQNLGIYSNYEEDFSYIWSISEKEECPFLATYDNEPVVSQETCQYLVDTAKADAYVELIDLLDSLPMPAEIEEQYLEEAMFWLEQGAISGIEESRVLVRNDMKIKNICNQTPTVAESSYEKGLVVGREHFINNFNTWLDKNGYIPDYPATTEQIEVCNADVSMLEPARKDALKSISKALEESPLCPDFEPYTNEMAAQYAQAQIDYSKALKEGVENEFALAAVTVFKVIPCNVSDPLILDLNGNGIFDVTSIFNGVNFDLHTEGRKQAMAWTNGDGFLFLDRNGNGIADNGLEFFGNQVEFRDGFEHLGFYDDNKDNFLSKKDEMYKNIYVWNDFNMDGICTPNETMTIEEYGIWSLAITKTPFHAMTQGGEVKYTSYAFINGSSKLLIGDIFFRNAVYASLK